MELAMLWSISTFYFFNEKKTLKCCVVFIISKSELKYLINYFIISIAHTVYIYMYKEEMRRGGMPNQGLSELNAGKTVYRFFWLLVC